MAKKAFAAIVLAILAIFAVPSAASAAGYVPVINITIVGNATAGGTVNIIFNIGSFTPGETVSFGVNGAGTATLGSVQAANVSSTKVASTEGGTNVQVTLPKNASGSYNVTATGLTSGVVGTATITTIAADSVSNTGLASTGYEAPVLLIWSAAGALLLGISLVVVLTIVRRQRATA
ncbi:hypothetical protein GY21_15855 [Cryobacterium roopkundense]|uniref:Sortase n=1 Tax=Cryobacterium roopkundense TaxID=1001240 RepID=A0A099J4I0_9MICO|nr:hypothetical protein [Cryobacterium roopkundense]KGJ72368.1 hypothetical protein GY21_15855 [Cryobacterium roopkundense]MBB5642376.1 hypothetical protein [Cryobacterium roopkundense]